MILNYKNQWQNTLENPYRFFFPISIIGLISGLILVLYPINYNIIFWHREILITLYLMPVATGFLYTATPRFFNSFFAKGYEIFLTILWILLLFVFYFLGNLKLYVIVKFIYLLQVFSFVLLRFLKRKSGNPLFAPFIFISLIAGLMGGLAQVFAVFFNRSEFFLYYHVLYLYAMFWILLFGVGTKFFPMLTLTTPLSDNRKYQILSKKVYNSHLFWYIFSILFLVTFIFEATRYQILFLWIRAILVLFLSYEAWYLYFPAQRKGIYTFFIKLFLYTIVIGHFLFPLFSEHKQHLYHILFVGGYLGLVLIVVGRVLISHEKLDLTLEVKSKILATIFTLIYIALWTRATAYLVKTYENHLKYASLTALIAIILYIIFFINNLHKRYKTSKKEL
jgi:hypothetical protein